MRWRCWRTSPSSGSTMCRSSIKLLARRRRSFAWPRTDFFHRQCRSRKDETRSTSWRARATAPIAESRLRFTTSPERKNPWIWKFSWKKKRTSSWRSTDWAKAPRIFSAKLSAIAKIPSDGPNNCRRRPTDRRDERSDWKYWRCGLARFSFRFRGNGDFGRTGAFDDRHHLHGISQQHVLVAAQNHGFIRSSVQRILQRFL